jgi:hypothetical protein
MISWCAKNHHNPNYIVSQSIECMLKHLTEQSYAEFLINYNKYEQAVQSLVLDNTYFQMVGNIMIAKVIDKLDQQQMESAVNNILKSGYILDSALTRYIEIHK